MNHDEQSAASIEDLFGKVIYSYTRAQAIADGEQIKIFPKLSKEAGIRFPVLLTRAAWGLAVELDDKARAMGEDVQGRLWDILSIFRLVARKTSGDRFKFNLMVGKKVVELHAQIGAMDIDDPSPAITIMTDRDI